MKRWNRVKADHREESNFFRRSFDRVKLFEILRKKNLKSVTFGIEAGNPALDLCPLFKDFKAMFSRWNNSSTMSELKNSRVFFKMLTNAFYCVSIYWGQGGYPGKRHER